jgi:3-methyl-2-oxobutanoate hydroxymethyltransferase
MAPRKKITMATILENKEKGIKMPRTALYDYPMAVLAEEAGIEIINVGDSLATVMLGYTTTIRATMDIMIEHAKAVRRGAPTAFIMGDMPYMSYQVSIEEAVRNAARYMVEADMDAVKMEGGLEILPTIRACTDASIPVIGHTGLTPQSAVMLGGYKTQARSAEMAMKILDVVKGFEKAGCVAVVVEAVPAEVGKMIYENASIPVFGSGCGPYSDSPMINWYDMLGFYDKNPKFAKKYGNIRQVILESACNFVFDCRNGAYPGPEHSYSMLPGEAERLEQMLKECG